MNIKKIKLINPKGSKRKRVKEQRINGYPPQRTIVLYENLTKNKREMMDKPKKSKGKGTKITSAMTERNQREL
jgi:hypothetical protein